MRARSRPALAIALALAAAACQSPDVGQRCNIGIVGIDPTTVPSDLLQTFNPVCDNLICIRSSTGAACTDAASVSTYPLDVRKYCSKACVSDKDCDNDRIHLVCRPIVLDSGYLLFLQQCASAQA